MKLEKQAGATSEIWQVFIQDSTSTTGAGLAGLVFNSGSLTAYYHRDTDTTATAIALVTMTVGTFTSSGFNEIDAAHMPGWYQFCPPNAAIAAGAKSCGFHLQGATNMAPLPIEVQLVAYNPDSASVTLPSIPSNWITSGGINAAALNGKGDWATVNPTNLTAAQIATGVWQDTTAGDFTVALSVGKSVMNGVSLGTGLTVNSLTNLPSIPNNWLTAAGISAAAFNGKGDWLLSSSYTAPLSAAATATAVWTDTTAGDFTTALSIGKSVMNGVSLGTGLTINALTGAVTLPTIPNNWIAAAGVASGAFDSGAFTAAAENAFADALLDRANGIETSFTPRQALRYAGSALVGVLAGAATTTVTIAAAANSGTNRITATVDANGNRSAVSLA